MNKKIPPCFRGGVLLMVFIGFAGPPKWGCPEDRKSGQQTFIFR